MDGFLKQSTEVKVGLGPFVSSADGHARQTALTITQGMVLLSKAGGAYAQKNLAKGAYHSSNGNYWATLDATDTATLGILKYDVDDNKAMSVFGSFQVIPRERYNQLFGSTDYLYSDLRQISGNAIGTDAASIDSRTKQRAALFDADTRLDISRANEACTIDSRSHMRLTLFDGDTRADISRLNEACTIDSRNHMRLTLFDADTRADISSINSLDHVVPHIRRTKRALVNKIVAWETTGTVDTYRGDDTVISGTAGDGIAAAFTSDSKKTTRLRLEEAEE